MYYVIMAFFMIFTLVLSVFLIWFVCNSAKYVVEKLLTKKGNRKRIKIGFKRFVICLVCMGVLRGSCSAFLAYSHMQEKENVLTNVLEVVLDKHDYEVDPYNNKKINVEQDKTYWDKWFETTLWFEEGSELINNYEGYELIDAYIEWLDKLTVNIEPEVLMEELAYFDGEYLRSPLELDDIIAQKEDPKEVDIAVYIEEFYSRVDIMLTSESGENIYQIARAANDVVFVHEEDFKSVHMHMFFITHSLYFYMESLNYEDVKETKADIYLKCGILIENLQNTIADTLDDKQKLYLQLLKNSFLAKASRLMTPEDNLCKENLAYYYGRSIYDTGQMCGINDAEYYRDALQLLREYINLDSATEIETCNDYISKIIKKYGQELL